MVTISERLKGEQESRRGGGSISSRISSRSTSKKKSQKLDVEDVDDLMLLSEQSGLEVKDPREKKPGLFTKTLDFISRPLFASAGAAKALVRGDENPWAEAWKGLQGKEKETYSDVLLEYDEKKGGDAFGNKFVRGGVGFILDVVLDPTTYFGGSLVKGVGKGVKIAGSGGVKAAQKFTPRLAENLTAKGTAVKDALGNAFVFGYGEGQKFTDPITTAITKIGISEDEIAKKGNEIMKGFRKQGIKKRDVFEADEIFRSNRLKAKELSDKGFTLKQIDEMIAGGKVFSVPTGAKAKIVYDKLLERADELNELFIKKTGFPEDQVSRFYSADILSDAAKGAIERKGKGFKSVLERGPENYKKEYKGLIKQKDVLENPIERMARVEAEIIRDAAARSITDDVLMKNPSPNFSSINEALKNGYVPIYRKATGEVVSDLDDISKVFNAAGDVVELKGMTPIGFLKKNQAEFLGRQLYPELSVLDGLAKATGFDGATALFKTMVTGYFPAFHVRNFISGIVQNYQVIGSQALNPVNWKTAGRVLKSSDDIIMNVKGHKLTGKELFEPFNNRFKGSSRYMADLGSSIDLLDNGMFKPGKALAKKVNNKARAMGDFVETTQKAVAYSAEVRMGLSKGLTPKKAIKDALKKAEEAGFDYSKVTPFEAKVMRRVIPFYTFGRKNAELQLKTLYKNPERILNQVKFASMLSQFFGGKSPNEEDLKGLPSWARDGLGFNLGDNKFVTQFGLPLEEFLGRVNEPFKTTTSSLNPIIKYPTEAKLGFDFFRGKDIKDIQKVSPEFAKFIETMPKPIQDQFQITSFVDSRGDKRYRANPDILHVLRNLPTARFQGTLEKQFSGDQTKLDKLLALMSGIKIYDIDLEQQAWFDERDAKRELQDTLFKAGVIGEFERAFIFKKDK